MLPLQHLSYKLTARAREIGGSLTGFAVPRRQLKRKWNNHQTSQTEADMSQSFGSRWRDRTFGRLQTALEHRSTWKTEQCLDSVS